MPPRSSASDFVADPSNGRAQSDTRRASRECTRSTVRSGRVRLLLACAAIGAVWLIVLPWLGSRPSIERSIRRQQAQGINPGALFYTDLEAMGPILQRMDRLRQQHPQALWSLSANPKRGRPEGDREEAPEP